MFTIEEHVEAPSFSDIESVSTIYDPPDAPVTPTPVYTSRPPALAAAQTALSVGQTAAAIGQNMFGIAGGMGRSMGSVLIGCLTQLNILPLGIMDFVFFLFAGVGLFAIFTAPPGVAPFNIGTSQVALVVLAGYLVFVVAARILNYAVLARNGCGFFLQLIPLVPLIFTIVYWRQMGMPLRRYVQALLLVLVLRTGADDPLGFMTSRSDSQQASRDARAAPTPSRASVAPSDNDADDDTSSSKARRTATPDDSAGAVPETPSDAASPTKLDPVAPSPVWGSSESASPQSAPRRAAPAVTSIVPPGEVTASGAPVMLAGYTLAPPAGYLQRAFGPSLTFSPLGGGKNILTFTVRPRLDPGDYPTVVTEGVVAPHGMHQVQFLSGGDSDQVQISGMKFVHAVKAAPTGGGRFLYTAFDRDSWISISGTAQDPQAFAEMDAAARTLARRP